TATATGPGNNTSIFSNAVGPASFVLGTDGAPEVKLYNSATLALRLDFFAYNPLFPGGVRVALGDVNGDGIPDIVTGPGSGMLPEVKVFNGKDGAVLYDFLANFQFNPLFTGGIFVAAGDTNGDGFADIIVGADAGGLPEVKVFNGRGGSVL